MLVRLRRHPSITWVVLLVLASYACKGTSQRVPLQPNESRSKTGAGSPSTQPNSDRAASSKCVRASDLPTPPRRITDQKPDLSDLQNIKTHAGVLDFDLVILPTGRVSDVRLVNSVDADHPWPTIAERWRSAISAWRFEPVILNDLPVAVCVTVTVNVHVM